MEALEAVLTNASAKERTHMNSRTEQVLLEKLKQLPPERVAEVEDFVDFLRSQNGSIRLSILVQVKFSRSLSIPVYFSSKKSLQLPLNIH